MTDSEFIKELYQQIIANPEMIARVRRELQSYTDKMRHTKREKETKISKIEARYHYLLGKTIRYTRARPEYIGRPAIVLSTRPDVEWTDSYPLTIMFIDDGKILKGMHVWDLEVCNG